jgi:hypothetical protein
MRKQKPQKKQPPAPQRDRVFIDRSRARDKLTLDLDTAIATAEEHGLSLGDVVEQLLLRAEQTAVLARERGEDLSRLAYLIEEAEL